jgi:hypothetical protein
MSGGSMDYLSDKVRNAPFYAKTPARRAFEKHLELVAEALHKIEWNDSGDGADGEEESIMACLREGALLELLIKEAEEARENLSREIERVKVCQK